MLATPAWAQVEPDTLGTGRNVERLLEDLGDDADDAEAVAEALGALAENPLDVNRATANELAQIPVISPILAARIVAYRTEQGRFGSLPELRAVPGLDIDEVYLSARPYLTIGEELPTVAREPSLYPRVASLAQLRSDVRGQLIVRTGRRFDVGEGYDEERDGTQYLGTPERYLTRFRMTAARQLSVGFVLEKDPGERFTWDPGTQAYGYDHVTGHVALEDAGRVKALVAGDFTVSFGQGLIFWRPGGFGKGREPVRPVARTGQGVRPFASSLENAFFRGGAAGFRITPRLTTHAFASKRRLDASIALPDTTLDERNRVATSLAQSGLHRTPSELDNKDALGETLAGGAVTYEAPRFTVGVAGYTARFEEEFDPGSQLYRRYAFRGDRADAATLFGHVALGPAYLFGETAVTDADQGRAVAFAGGALLDVARGTEIIVQARSFPKDFTSLHGSAFAESGSVQNERGLYAGLRTPLAENVRLLAYVDQYRFPWVRFGVPRPSSGYETRVVLEHAPRRWLNYYLEGFAESRDRGVPTAAGLALDQLQRETRLRLRLHGDYVFNSNLTLDARIEGLRFRAEGEPDDYGFLIYGQVRYEPIETLSFTTRLTTFDTDSYDARLYAYENDLLYAFSVPVFNGRGQRAFLLIRARPVDQLVIEAKVAASLYEDVETVGSGLDEVEGRVLREGRLQIRWKW